MTNRTQHQAHVGISRAKNHQEENLALNGTNKNVGRKKNFTILGRRKKFYLIQLVWFLRSFLASSSLELLMRWIYFPFESESTFYCWVRQFWVFAQLLTKDSRKKPGRSQTYWFKNLLLGKRLKLFANQATN